MKNSELLEIKYLFHVGLILNFTYSRFTYSRLKFIILNYNNLSGSIPDDIGDLVNVTHLRLDNNNLTGEIPPSIGDMINMEYLYLRNNNLSGEIPQSICNIDSLRSFLNYNNLCPGVEGYPDCIPQNYIGFQYDCED